MHINVAEKDGVTQLRRAYCTQPFKVMDITENKRDSLLQVMLMSSSPGILDGDEYNMEINLGQASSLELQTQSYQRLFSMKQGAVQNIRVYLQKNAFFRFLPHPVVPHEGADFISSSKIYLSAGCTLLWGEVLTCGRKLNGEIFRFTRYHAITEIFLSGKLVIKENLLMQPGLFDINGLGQLEGFTHQATLIFLHETEPVKELIELAINCLKEQQDIMYGVTAAPVNGIIVRMLGNKAEQLHKIVQSFKFEV